MKKASLSKGFISLVEDAIPRSNQIYEDLAKIDDLNLDFLKTE